MAAFLFRNFLNKIQFSFLKKNLIFICITKKEKSKKVLKIKKKK